MLTFTNAREFNPPTSIYHREAKRLEVMADRLFPVILPPPPPRSLNARSASARRKTTTIKPEARNATAHVGKGNWKEKGW